MQREAAIIKFSVTDTGVGIPQDKLDTIFEGFQQASTSTTKEFGGTGLGLTITKRLVELHGGNINVESTEGKGSIFSFTIPLKVADTSQKSHAPNGKKANLGDLAGLKILVVEDIKINRLLMKRVLERLSIEVDLRRMASWGSKSWGSSLMTWY